MQIDDVTLSAKGVGGSWTRWQGKPPAHIELRFDINGDKYVGNFHFRETWDGDDLDLKGVVDQVTSDYKFNRLPKDLREEMKKIAKEKALESEFFGITKEEIDKEKLDEVS